jgi:hypothetical protein
MTGWVYVSGLREDDDPEIAVLYDKAWGVGGSGGRIRSDEKIVLLINGTSKRIRKSDWKEFEIRQQELIRKLRR